MNHWLPACVDLLDGARSRRALSRSQSRAVSHVSVQATRWAPFSSPVSSRSSAQLGDGACGVERHARDPTTVLDSVISTSQRAAPPSRGNRAVPLASRLVLRARGLVGSLGAVPLGLDLGRLDAAVRRRRHVDAARLDDLAGVRPARAGEPARADHASSSTRRSSPRRRRPSASRSARSSASRSASCSSTRACSSAASCPTSSRARRCRSSRSRRWSSSGSTRSCRALQGWGAVAVIAAYLTFFPVAINTLRGLQSADPRALELMRTYAAEPLDGPVEAARARARSRTSSRRSRSPRRRASSARSSASCRPGSRTGSAARSSTSTSTTRSSRRSSGRRTSSPPLLGILFFVVVVARREGSSSAARRRTSHERRSRRLDQERHEDVRARQRDGAAGHRPRARSPASSSR